MTARLSIQTEAGLVLVAINPFKIVSIIITDVVDREAKQFGELQVELTPEKTYSGPVIAVIFGILFDESAPALKLDLSKRLLSEDGLTITHSGTGKNIFGGEEETSSRRRRRSRWDPQPSESTTDVNSGTIGGRQRKSMWADDEPKPIILLLD